MPIPTGQFDPHIKLPDDTSWLKNLWKSLIKLKFPPPSLDDWLAQRPALRAALVWERPPPQGSFVATPVAWQDWNTDERLRLKQAFSQAWADALPIASTPFVNQFPPPANEYPRTCLSVADAASQYFETAAACLAFEARLPVGSPRSLSTADAETLAHFFDSRSLFAYQSFPGNCYGLNERFLPARPGYVLQWLKTLALPANATIRQCVDAVVGYCGQFFHFAGAPDAAHYQAHWHYLGGCPMVRVIEKTVPDPVPENISPLQEPRHYTGGCFGTTSFLEHALRVLNIRVKREIVVGHTLPHFTQIGMYLSHGDDPYGLKNNMSVAPDALLIDQATFDAWFGPGVADAEREHNIGRRARELFSP